MKNIYKDNATHNDYSTTTIYQLVIDNGKNATGGDARGGTEGINPQNSNTFTPSRKTFKCMKPLGPQSICALRMALLSKQMITENTSQKELMDFFSGEDSDCKITWIGKKSALYYFIKQIREKDYAREVEGGDVWIIVRSHFVDEKGNYFPDDINQQHDPKKLMKDLDNIVEILSPDVNFDEMDKEEFANQFSDLRLENNNYRENDY